jgi:hypothetical protein
LEEDGELDDAREREEDEIWFWASNMEARWLAVSRGGLWDFDALMSRVTLQKRVRMWRGVGPGRLTGSRDL